jgi:hypothetical protein
MKNILFAFLLLISITTLKAQKDPSVAVISTFKLKFPKAQKVNWTKEANGDFEAEFKLNEKKMSANFTPKGDWVETESPIDITKIPPAVGASFKRQHEKAKIKLAYKIETAKQFKYEIEYKEGSKTQEVIYDIDGKVLKNEGMKK